MHSMQRATLAKDHLRYCRSTPRILYLRLSSASDQASVNLLVCCRWSPTTRASNPNPNPDKVRLMYLIHQVHIGMANADQLLLMGYI